MTLTLQNAIACMQKILAALADPQVSKQIEAARELAEGDPEKIVVEIIPMFYEIQGHVMTPFGFEANDDGFASFSAALKAHELDQGYNDLANQYKAFIKQCTATTAPATRGLKRGADEVDDEEEEGDEGDEEEPPTKCGKAALGLSVTREAWGEANDTKVSCYTLRNEHGVQVKITNFGGAITSFILPSNNGPDVDIVMGYDNLDAYLNGKANFGSIIGRVANRIANGKFSLNGQEYQLTLNNGPHHLHGGPKGYCTKVFAASTATNDSEAELTLKYKSEDGEEGYPGTLDITVTYTLTNENKFRMEFRAVADADTIVNLTNHAYWNLAGHDSGTVFEHTLQVNADEYTAVDDTGIPTGERLPLMFSPLDFRTKKQIGSRLNAVGGYDHNYVIDQKKAKEQGGTGLPVLAVLSESKSSRSMTVASDQPGLQVYTGNLIDAANPIWKGKGGAIYQKFGAVCLEPQLWPDAINHIDQGFPNPILLKGDVYKHTTVLSFTF